MNIQSKFKNYSVEFVNSFEINAKLENLDNSFYVIDSKVYELYKDENFFNIPTDKIKIVDATESNKTITTALDICESIMFLNAKRNTHLIAIGGGIIQDLSGFAANILYRGLTWTFIPTTLLAAADSCIGGKSSLNFKDYKNILGTFYPPDNILIYQNFFRTLTERDFLSGLGEVVKFNILSGDKNVSKIESDIDQLLMRENRILTEYIKKSLLFKKTFIEEDEFDKGKRILLNYAHTFGHAIETTTNYLIPHGIAVSMGAIYANYISLKRGLIDFDYYTKVRTILKRVIPEDCWSTHFDYSSFIHAMKKDKKQTDDKITVVLLKSTNEMEIVKNIHIDEIKEALTNAFSYKE